MNDVARAGVRGDLKLNHTLGESPRTLASTPATPKEKTLLAFLIWRGCNFFWKRKGCFLSGFCPPSIRAVRGFASGENFEDKKNFLKKIGSNPHLAQRALRFSPKKSWEILLNSWDSATPATFARASREQSFGLHTDWLPGWDSSL